VVSINSLRADHLSCYGYERNTTPYICGVAADGTRYTRAYSQFHWTTPSEASIQSGLYPAVHGVKHPDDGPSELPSTMTMPEQLAAAGYGTHGIFVRDNWTYRNDTGMQRGFEEVHPAGSLDPHRITDWLRSPGPDLVYTLPMELHRPYTHDWVRPGDQYTAGYNGTLTRLWDADGDLPGGLLYNTTMGPDGVRTRYRGEVIELTQEDTAYLRGEYDTMLRHIDARLGSVISDLKEDDMYADTLIVITAPHGETLADDRAYPPGATRSAIGTTMRRSCTSRSSSSRRAAPL